MRIHCDDLSVFDEAQHRGLQRMLMRVRQGQHALILDDVDGFYRSRFFVQAVADGDRQEVRELLEQQHPFLSDRALDPGARAPGPRAELVPVALSSNTCSRHGEHPVWCVDPSTVGDFCEAPLRILLENDQDWVLVDVAVRIYHRPHVSQALERSFLRKDQRGGKGEVKKAIGACRADERVFVIVDSDRCEVFGPEGHEQREMRNLATTRPNVSLFILKKREAENYIPETIWIATTGQAWNKARRRRDAVIKRRQMFAEWRQLPEDAKDVIDLESYFSDAKSHLPKLADPLYVPDAKTLESRDTEKELMELLDRLEAWL